jgi:EAL domain-containing protein (putative c-di-GMP-specific phosphodiesterase class I)
MSLPKAQPKNARDCLRVLTIADLNSGTGSSSLAYLEGLPFDTLEIDRSFISGLPDDSASVTAITVLGKSPGFEVLAEEAQTQVQRRFLLGVGCRRAQGYLYKPARRSRLFGS